MLLLQFLDLFVFAHTVEENLSGQERGERGSGGSLKILIFKHILFAGFQLFILALIQSLGLFNEEAVAK